MDTLIHRAKKHDKAAFGELMRIYSVSMYKIAKAILKNDEDAADAIQETALTCWEKIDMLKNDGYFKTWMTRILINHCNALYQKRRKTISGELLPETGFLENDYSTIEWKEFLRCLDEKYRIIVILHYVEGFKIREIAEILQISENTVSTRLSSARKKMKKQYSQKPAKKIQIVLGNCETNYETWFRQEKLWQN